ncbi:MAG TPA: phosphate ABC transporter substrate-binding protein PstS [Tepidisphaeraceae bacterium]|jgi:phosphate ABC transporter phosphate-binding protein|nr:phosphate ABC transporter substrate-binding protein PstS [Tepidisphaeraceae bacterium]
MQKIASVFAAVGLLVSVAASANAEVRIQGAGSTFVAPIMQRWVTEFQKVDQNARIDYQSIGSGGGVKSFIEKTVDFGASDAPLSKKEFAQVGGPDAVVQIPVIAGAIVAGYNIPGLQGDLKLDGPVLADIFQGKIKKWNDPRIAALNAGTALPDLAIMPVHRTDGSGTTFIFTSYLATQSENFKETVGAAKQVEWPGGAGGKGNEGVTEVVQGTKGAIGYIELAYALQNKVPFAEMKNKDGHFVKASPASTSAAGESALKAMDSNNAAPLWNQAGAEVYPIAGYTYVFVRRDLAYLKDEAKAKALGSFLVWATQSGQAMAGDLGYAPLSDGVKNRAHESLAKLAWSGAPLLSAGK